MSGYIVASADVVSADDVGGLAAGFFGLVGQSAEIRGLTVGGVVSVDIGTNTDKIYIHAGGIAGTSYGTITDNANSGEVSASGDSNENNAGGIAGTSYGTITNNAHIGGTVTASGGSDNYAGGIAGYNDLGNISNSCWLAGDLEAVGGGDGKGCHHRPARGADALRGDWRLRSSPRLLPGYSG